MVITFALTGMGLTSFDATYPSKPLRLRPGHREVDPTSAALDSHQQQVWPWQWRPSNFALAATPRSALRVDFSAGRASHSELGVLCGALALVVAARRGARRHSHDAASLRKRRSKLRAEPLGASTEVVGARDRTTLGTLSIPRLGVGTLNWPLDKESDDPDTEAVVRASMDLGVDFFDTAEAYGFGRCERLTAHCLDKASAKGLVATKFAPVPWRSGGDDVLEACKASAGRLGVKSLDLYQIHFPDLIQPLKVFGLEQRKDEAYWDGLAQCYKEGLAKNVGVSNYGPEMLQRAFDALAARGVPLASNQFNYSLLYRRQGSQRTLDKCKELGITALAYFPLGMGLLTGKYDAEQMPSGLKGFTMKKYLRGGSDGIPEGGVTPLVAKLRLIAQRQQRTVSQVALNWIICKGAVPIPGARTEVQAVDNAGALGWRLSEEEVAELEETADGLGFEFSGGGFKLE